jgi:hypothetical protein
MEKKDCEDWKEGIGSRSLMELAAMVGSLSIRDNNLRITG